MFFTALGVDPLVTCAGQLQASLPSPLLGPVPVPADRGDGPAAAEHWGILALNVRAGVLVFVCVLAIALAFR